MAPLAQVIGVAVAVITLLVLAGILLIAFKANLANTVAHYITSWSSTLTSPFHGLFHPRNPRAATAVNWGIAAAVYFVAGQLLRRILLRFSPASQ